MGTKGPQAPVSTKVPQVPQGVFMAIDFEKFIQLLPAGRDDLLTWSALMSGFALNHPATIKLVESVVPPLAGNAQAALLAMGVAAAFWGGDRIYRRWREIMDSRVFDSEVFIRSDPELPSPSKWHDWDGVLIGYCVDSGEPIIIDWDHWMRHAFIIGQSGVGKTVLGEWLMFQQIVRGGGVIFIDGKIDEGNLRKIHAMATWAGRRDDLLVVNPGNPEQSNTYNPILFGDADEVAARILSLIPSTESNPGADHYRQQANQAIVTVVGAIKTISANQHLREDGIEGLAYNFLDLSLILNNQRALEMLLDRINLRADAGRQLLAWLEPFKNYNKETGRNTIDMKKMKDAFGGVGGRMHTFGTGKFGKITSSYYPEVNLFDAIVNNKIVYIALPTMGKAEAASNFGKMAVGDYRTAVSWVQALPKNKRPWPPTLCFFDEAGSYVTPAWSRIFEQARSAHQVLVPAVQTIANLDAVSKELRAMVIGNTWTKIMFKLGEAETIKTLTEIIGKEKYGSFNVGYGQSEGDSKQASSAAQSSMSASQSKNVILREIEDYRVRPTTLSKLPKGEAIVLYGNTRLYHIKIPMIEFTREFYDKIGKFEVNRLPTRRVEGLDFAAHIDRLITD